MTEHTRMHLGGVHARAILAGPPDAGEAVVFVHGNPGSADDWERFVAAAGETGTRALALDLPDFGETEAPAGFAHTTEGYAAWLGEALAGLGVERAHLVLHDFGGPIGLTWAAGAPQRVASVTLIDTGVLPGYRWHRMARIWRTPVLGEIFQATATKRAFRIAVGRSEPRGLPPAFLDRMYENYDRRTKRAVLKLYRATDDPSALSERVTAILRPHDIPALVVWGEHDAYLPNAFAARQRDAFPAAEVHVLAASGHWPFVDAADTVERLLMGFLERVAAPGAARAEA
jgi:pimeloyl-ACP methyl ester carboxylesterase